MQKEDSVNSGMLKNEEAHKSKRLQTSGSNNLIIVILVSHKKKSQLS